MNARAKPTPTSARTRDQLIFTGERLFAERGIDNVSLRQINGEAGQRNSSAAHYHFGSKETLVRAIYEFRMVRVDAGRRALLDRFVAEGRDRDMDALLEALVLPLVHEIDDSDGGQNFIRFVAQLLGHPLLDLRAMWRGELSTSLGTLFYGLHRAVPGIPDEIFGPRFGLMWELLLNGLADRERLRAVADATLDLCPNLYVTNLIDILGAVIAAPVSTATQRNLEAMRGRGPRGH